MGGKKYYFNPDKHRFEAIKPDLGRLLVRIGVPALAAVLLSFGIKFSLGESLPDPKEMKLQEEKEAGLARYLQVSERLMRIESSLSEIQNRDDQVYRAFYQMDPLATSLREAGLGGTDRYAYLEGYESSSFLLSLTRKVDRAGVKLEIQSGSFEEVQSHADYHWNMLNHIPSIQPVSLEDYFWVSSAFGYRTDPMSKRRTMHKGMDFAGRTGIKVYATGDGVVVRTKDSRTGFGKEVLIDHGFGYVTRYGHMQSILVHRGQQVKRGSVIGTLGSTGKSTGPHLHYEVRHFGLAKDPRNYFSDDLSAEEYSRIVSLDGAVDN
jgi:murein DD-endopeptidase MepM/ murein hydrolase activator NlpD